MFAKATVSTQGESDFHIPWNVRVSELHFYHEIVLRRAVLMRRI